MTSDILNSIKATLYDRISNPLLGAFFASWFIWNYKFVWVLFSASTFPEKFQHIDKILYPAGYLMFWHFLVMPACFAYLYLYWLPKLSHIVYEHYQTKQKELKEIKQKIEDEIPLTQEESRKLRTEIRMLEVKHQEEMEMNRQKYQDQDMEVVRMTSEIDQLRNNLADAENKTESKISKYEADLRILNDEKERLELENKQLKGEMIVVKTRLEVAEEKQGAMISASQSEDGQHGSFIEKNRQRLQDEVRDLKDALEKEKQKSKNKENIEFPISGDGLTVLLFLANNEKAYSSTRLSSKLVFDKKRMVETLEDLQTGGFIDSQGSRDARQELYYNVTKKGMDFLKDYHYLDHLADRGFDA